MFDSLRRAYMMTTPANTSARRPRSNLEQMTMTKNERRELDKARALVRSDHCDMAARTISIVYRSARKGSTQAAALALAVELGLADRVTMYNGCLAHVADVPAVRS